MNSFKLILILVQLSYSIIIYGQDSDFIEAYNKMAQENIKIANSFNEHEQAYPQIMLLRDEGDPKNNYPIMPLSFKQIPGTEEYIIQYFVSNLKERRDIEQRIVSKNDDGSFNFTYKNGKSFKIIQFDTYNKNNSDQFYFKNFLLQSQNTDLEPKGRYATLPPINVNGEKAFLNTELSSKSSEYKDLMSKKNKKLTNDCKKLLKKNKNISYSDTFKEYIQNIDIFNKSTKNNSLQPIYISSYRYPNGVFDFEKTTDEVLKLSYANEIYKKSNGRFVINYTSGPNNPQNGAQATQIIDTLTGKNYHIETPTLSFCNGLTEIENYIKNLKTPHEGPNGKCYRFIESDQYLIGSPLGSYPLSKLNIHFDPTGEVIYETKQSQVNRNSEFEHYKPLAGDDYFSIKKSKSGFPSLVRFYQEKKGFGYGVYEREYYFEQNTNGECYLKSYTDQGKTMPNIKQCISYKSLKFSSTEFDKNNDVNILLNFFKDESLRKIIENSYGKRYFEETQLYLDSNELEGYNYGFAINDFLKKICSPYDTFIEVYQKESLNSNNESKSNSHGL